MKEEIVNNVLCAMSSTLNAGQLEELKMQLYIQLSGCNLQEKSTEIIPYQDNNYIYLKKFLASKTAAGKAESTIKVYYWNLRNVLDTIAKDVKEVDADDIRNYLYISKKQRNIGKTTMRNIRAVMSSFFSWLYRNGIIIRNPVDLVEPIKPDQTIKEAFSDEEIIKMKDNCTNIRDLALLDFLNSSMVRVGELEKLNISDIDFNERELTVFGKGSKERLAYFDGEAKIHLLEYLESRTDSNPALFVSLRKSDGSYDRLSISGVQDVLKRIGEKSGVEKVHPHRFRRTGATRNLEKGIPIDQVKELLGHVKIETTMIYAKTNKKIVKMNYQRLN